jgi:hypothetical protein
MFVPAFADTVLLESGGINVSNVPLSSPSPGGSLRLDPAISGL